MNKNDRIKNGDEFNVCGHRYRNINGIPTPILDGPIYLPGEDYGADPLGDETFKMVPSGDIVNFEERNKRLKK